MRAPARLAPAAVLLLTAALAGCSGEDSAPGPEEAAAELARGLAAGDLDGVALAGATAAEAQESYDAVVAGVRSEDQAPSVEVGDVREAAEGSEEEAASAATATLTWSWPVMDGEEWTYESQAELRRAGEEWQVAWDPSVVEPGLTEGEVLDRTTLAPDRGEITGAGGTALVTDRPVVTFGIDKPRAPLRQAVADARGLAALVGTDPAAYAAQVREAGDEAFVEAITYRDDEVPPAVSQGIGALDSVIAIPGRRPLAPTKEFAAPLLGTVGDVTAEMIEEDPSLQAGDEAGLSGLQARYDDQLQGTPGVLVEAVGADGAERELFRVEPTPGEELPTTLDVDLQLAAERVLAQVGPASALVAVRPSDGAVLAAANGPGNAGLNIATYGQLAPGSTFKTVSSLALLRAGLRPGTRVPCTATLTVDGRRFTNYSDYPASGLGDVPLRTAVANSCNTAFISQRDELERGSGTDALAEAAGSLGLGVDHDLGFPAFFGSLEPPASETAAAADLIGQGKVLASPMVMATVMASVQEGTTVVPRLLEQVEVSVPEGVEPLRPAEARALRSLLRSVVTDGSGAQLADVPGPPVLAKTGTAEFEDGGRIDTHAWMVAAQGDLAVAVFVKRGESGSSTAGPLLESFLRAARRAGG